MKNNINSNGLRQDRFTIIDIKNYDVVEIAKKMKTQNCRLITITCFQNKEDNFEIIYHYSDDNFGDILNYRIFLDLKKGEHHILSIIDFFPNALRYEQEINELYNLWFDGNPKMGERLFIDEESHKHGDHPHLHKH